MKTKLIFVRHGFSVSNQEHFFSGSIDVPLTALGRQQAEKCADYFLTHQADAVYASDLKRAYDTAVPIARVLGLPIVKERGMREIYAGDWEGLPFQELIERYPKEYGVWLRDIGKACCPGGETVKEFAERIYSTVARIAEENQGRTVCIATHATPIRVLCTLAQGLPITEMGQVKWVKNASINVFSYENGRLTALSLDGVEHLGGECTGFPEGV